MTSLTYQIFCHHDIFCVTHGYRASGIMSDSEFAYEWDTESCLSQIRVLCQNHALLWSSGMSSAKSFLKTVKFAWICFVELNDRDGQTYDRRVLTCSALPQINKCLLSLTLRWSFCLLGNRESNFITTKSIPEYRSSVESGQWTVPWDLYRVSTPTRATNFIFMARKFHLAHPSHPHTRATKSLSHRDWFCYYKLQ